jgi:hypothetical protein
MEVKVVPHPACQGPYIHRTHEAQQHNSGRITHRESRHCRWSVQPSRNDKTPRRINSSSSPSTPGALTAAGCHEGGTARPERGPVCLTGPMRVEEFAVKKGGLSWVYNRLRYISAPYTTKLPRVQDERVLRRLRPRYRFMKNCARFRGRSPIWGKFSFDTRYKNDKPARLNCFSILSGLFSSRSIKYTRYT